MRSFDLSPLFRNSVGFDRMARMIDSMANETQATYPPYNIEKLSEQDYAITMAVAGFSEDDLDISVHQNMLSIAGNVKHHQGTMSEDEPHETTRTFLYRGIAERSFERRFSLADHIEVTGARMENGLLHVLLHHEVPEAAKPRKVEIASSASSPKTIKAKAKAV